MKLQEAFQTREDGERGSSLLEVLIALLIFLLLMIGVLQMFSLAFLVNEGAAARTEMTYKCQEVIENMRYLNYMYKYDPANPGVAPSIAALPTDLQTWWPLAAGATHDLYSSATFNSDVTTLNGSYWGPLKTNVVEYPKPRYAITMTIADSGTGLWVLTVTARPNSTAGANKYIGYQPKRRIVEYVAYLQQ